MLCVFAIYILCFYVYNTLISLFIFNVYVHIRKLLIPYSRICVQAKQSLCIFSQLSVSSFVKMIPPRGCAYIVMIHRQDAFRALQKLSRGSYKVNQKAIKVSKQQILLLRNAI